MVLIDLHLFGKILNSQMNYLHLCTVQLLICVFDLNNCRTSVPGLVQIV
jgi:hypothetical protein